ncbi:DUF2971 domain-containing protein [Pseudoxanthomonas sp.]|uniref:DUF2971 domain-containing protein n=1 Tax=Pseudoxanthomonas sp. TaxID=1871049 RepID=UPI0026101965|nr:DUF2971 domain-containing protein [Pseudoxanthomonas sp.]WDS37333.1 MAG: DUF2971 domain-containing protein [Pseudoxanthomonas sp.]
MEDHGAPERVFKYLSPARIGILSDQLVRYTPLGAFNDPFEGRPEITQLASNEAAVASFAAAIPSELEAAYSSLPAALRTRFSLQQWVRFATPLMQQQQGQFLAMLGAVSNRLIPAIPAKMDEVLGVLSLCEIPDSLLMWAHYGMSHTGFVLELDSRHPYFNARRTDQDEFGHLRQVRYRDVRPSASLIDLDGTEMFLVKSKEWSYEREWRVLRPLKDAHNLVNANGEDIHLFQLPPYSIKAVILGVRASTTLADQARQAISSNSAMSHIKLLRCVPDESCFAIRIVADAA